MRPQVLEKLFKRPNFFFKKYNILVIKINCFTKTKITEKLIKDIEDPKNSYIIIKS